MGRSTVKILAILVSTVVLSAAVGPPVIVHQKTGDPTLNLLPSYDDAYANWKNAGLLSVGGIPTRTTQCGSTVSPTGKTPPTSGDDYAVIQAAINACTVGQVVQLANGVFHFDQSEGLTINKGITLRGGACDNSSTPYCKTEIIINNGGVAWQAGRTCGAPNTGCPDVATVTMAPSNSQWGTCTYANPASSACATTVLDANAAQGDTKVQVHSTTPFSVGSFVRIDEAAAGGWLTDPMGNLGQIWATSDFLSSSGSPATGRIAYAKHNPECCSDDYAVADNPATAGWQCAYSWLCDRETAEIHKISALGDGPCPGVNCTLTFDDPLIIAMRQTGNHNAYVYNAAGFVQYAGLENLTLFKAAGASVIIDFCAYCWTKNVEARGWEHDGIILGNSARVQIDSSFITDAYSSCNNGDEYPVMIWRGSTEIYMVNSITRFGGKGMTIEAAGAGSVIAYNYIDDQMYAQCPGPNWVDTGANASHFTGPHHVLFEGNWTSNMDNERTHGNSIYLTYFENYSQGYRSTFVNPNTGGTINDLTGTLGTNGSAVLRAVGPQAYSYWHSYIGNVLGSSSTTAANHWAANCVYVDSLYTYKGCIWMLGWNDMDQNVNDPNINTNGYIFRHGNYDYLSNSVSWDSNTTNHNLPISFYLRAKPGFFANGSGYTWPWVNPTGGTKLLTLPAKARFDAGTPFVQP